MPAPRSATPTATTSNCASGFRPRGLRLPQRACDAARHSTLRRREIMPHLMLVSFKPSPWVQRSAILLREKNTSFEFRHIESDNRPDWFLAISPHKKVPVLQIDNGPVLFESSAINEYLD